MENWKFYNDWILLLWVHGLTVRLSSIFLLRFISLDWCLFRYIGRFTFEQIQNMKEQIYFYERAENHKAKERMFKSFKWANFPGKHPDAGMDWIIDCWKGVWGSLCWFILSILNIPWKWNNLVSVRPDYFIFIGYLIAGMESEFTPSGSATVMRSQSPVKHWAILAITGNTTEGYLFKGHYLENLLIWMNYPPPLLTVWFSAHFILRHGMISTQT